jgi:hypothetical protein
MLVIDREADGAMRVDKECCTYCDNRFSWDGVYYWQRARVCRRCHEELAALLLQELALRARRDYARRARIGRAWARRHCTRKINFAECALLVGWLAIVAGVSAYVLAV